MFSSPEENDVASEQEICELRGSHTHTYFAQLYT